MVEAEFLWPNQIRGAISLTYDDGLPIHYTLVAPLLRQHGLLATFYPPIHGDLGQHPENWRCLAGAGHELGNHTIFHPCRQRHPDPYPWLDNHYDLGTYTLEHLRSELEVANLVLHLLDGQTDRSYGSTCGDMTVGRGWTEESIEPLLAAMFVAARGKITNQAAQPGYDFIPFNIACISADGCSLDELTQMVERTRRSCAWSVLVFHGIGTGTHDLYLDADILEQFIGLLARLPDLWIAPVRTIAFYIKQHLPAAH